MYVRLNLRVFDIIPSKTPVEATTTNGDFHFETVS